MRTAQARNAFAGPLRLLAVLAALPWACGQSGSEDKGPFHGTISVSPSALTFSGTADSTTIPAAQTLTISSTGTVYVEVLFGGIAHEAAPTQFTGSTGVVTVGVPSPANIGPGVHTGVVTVNGYLANTPGAPTATGSPANVGVTYTVPGLTWNRPLGTPVVVFNQSSGGSLPAAQSITIRDVLGASYEWAVTSIEYAPIIGLPALDWLAVSPTAGTSLPAALTLSVAAQGRPSVEYHAYVNLASASPPYTLRVWVIYRAH